MAMPGVSKRGDEFGRLRSQRRVHPALHDPEQGLVEAGLRFQRTLRPTMSPLHGFFDVGVVVRVGTFVERHDDIGAEILLNGNRLFRREAMRRTVDVTLEGHAVFVDLAGLRERKNLKAARVGQHGVMPLHEPVQPAHIADEFIAGAQVEMIGVAQDQRSVDVFEMLGREGFDSGLRSHGGKDRRDQVAMRG
jgi:hypothetical protein